MIDPQMSVPSVNNKQRSLSDASNQSGREVHTAGLRKGGHGVSYKNYDCGYSQWIGRIIIFNVRNYLILTEC